MLYIPGAFFFLAFIISGCLTSSGDKDQQQKPSLEVDAALLDFGETADVLLFHIILTGGETDWKIAESELPAWCHITVERNSTGASVSVSVDREELSPGEYTASITVAGSTGSHSVKVRMVVPEETSETGIVIIDIPIPEKEGELP
jgi:hypothetical protein